MSRALPERMTVLQGDITLLEVSAIVNAANESLLGGGGVDGAIHRAAGPRLLEYNRSLGGCPTGQVRLSPGFDLPAPWIIHTVGPVWQGGSRGEAALLESCYRLCLELAAEHSFESLAFPAISTGVYGYPKEAATRVALESTARFLAASEYPRSVVFCCFSEADARLYHSLHRSVPGFLNP